MRMVIRLGSLVLLLVLLSSIHAEGYTESTYHIKPTPDTLCPEEPCLTLSEYAQGHPLTSNTTLIFLPGNHSLDRDISITNVTRFVMLGHHTSSLNITSRIVCKGPEMLTFHNISLLHIHFVQISSCGSDTVPALSLISVSEVEVLDSVFQDNGKASLLVVGSMLNCSGTNFSSGSGFGLILSKGFVEVYNCLFSSNSGGGINSTNSTLTLVGTNTFINNSADFGGGVLAIESSIYITGNTAFLDNSVWSSGGGVCLERSTLNCNGTVTFSGNIISGSDGSAGMTGTGGGISALNSGISLSGNCSFIDNVATDGGALFLKLSQINCSGYISFVNNHADGNGGGLLLSSSKANLEGTSSFISNAAYYSGGALSSVYSTVRVDGDGRFINNSAELGGGIAIGHGSDLTLNGNYTFAENLAYQGGGIDVQDSCLSSNGHVSFINNVASVSGGAFIASGGDLALNGNYTFAENVAYQGGGILVQNSSLSSNGCISFVNNHADGGGGGLLLSNSKGKLEGTSSFISNSANYGGGASVLNQSILELSKNSLFEKNVAEQYAGGIYVENSWFCCGTFRAYNGSGALSSVIGTVKLYGESWFINNTAVLGGGIYVLKGSDLTLDGNITFAQNQASQGGGINVQHSYLCSRGNISFINNVADDIGGGLLLRNASVKLEGGLWPGNSSGGMDGDGMFMNNSAEWVGGGIAILHGGSLTLNGCYTFAYNLAYHGGGISVQDSSLSSRGNISFISNVANYSGGGLTSDNSTVRVEGYGRFIKDMAKFGGGIAVSHGGDLALKGNYTFAENQAYQGGGINVHGSSLSSSGKICFQSNVAYLGGGLLSFNSFVKLEDSSSFMNNSARSGGALTSEHSTVRLEGEGMFINNSAEWLGGGVVISHGADLTLNGNYTFTKNMAYQGAGIFVQDSSLCSSGYINSINNVATGAGGGLISYNSTVSAEGDSRFINNSALAGGGICILSQSDMTLNGGYIMFAENRAHHGAGVLVQDSSLSSRGCFTFTNNVANGSGGGLSLSSSTVSMEGDGRFIHNSANLGGGICIVNQCNLNLNGDYNFAENRAHHGAGILVRDSSMSSRGHFKFINNVANDSGRGLTSDNSSMRLYDSFINGTADYFGGALYSEHSTVRMEGDGRFINNSAKYGGGIAIRIGSNLTLNGNSTFADNVAYIGGGIYVIDSSLSNSGHISFLNNVAIGSGGGLLLINSSVNLEERSSFVSFNSSVQLEGGNLNKSAMMFEVGDGKHDGNVICVNNSAQWGGGFLIKAETNLSITVPSMFARNTAKYGGGGVGLYTGCTVTFSGINTFTQNTATYGGGVHLIDSTMRFMARSDVSNNTAVYGGGIQGSRATLKISETVSLTENSATNGGGLSLAGESQCFLSGNSTVYLRSNHAEQYGGGIFVADEPVYYCTINKQPTWVTDAAEQCFFQPIDLDNLSVQFILDNNTAGEAGTALYGGMVDKCDFQRKISQNRFIHSGVMFSKIFSITKSYNSSGKLVISSDPFQVCPCYDGLPNCSQSDVTVTAYPGETFSIPVVAIGQRNGTVPSLIQSSFDGVGASLGDLQEAQSANNTCTPLYYTVSSTNSQVAMTLLADGPCLDLGENLQVNIHLKPCPIGFELSETSQQCICEHRLQKYTNSCNIDDLTVGFDGNAWVGLARTADGVITHSHCPFDYCKSHSVRFTLNETDLQCNYDRRGLLCGGCQPGLSLALGSSHCLQCSNTYLSLLVVFALAGIALVVLLLLCKLTVAVGTINGLIFYANIIAVNQSVFFPSGDTNVVLDILRVFISWLNLDLGIETCFYDGMDAYARTWLQFIFPVYIWVLVFTVMILCYYKTWAVRMFGRNPVAVLATLFLLSYAKLIRTIITALSFAFLEYPDGSEVAVWLYDGNVRYLKGKHIPLFLVAMAVLLLLFLPYTVVLSLGQWILARSRNRLFSWISDYRVKAFLDAYHGPFKDEHRYWHGLLLVVRSCLFLIFAFNRLGNPNVNLLAIVICTIALLILLVFSGGNIYVNWYLQILDISFIANTGVFAAVTLYLRHAGGNQGALVYTSVGIALVTFAGMIIYHLIMQLKDSRVWKDIICPKLKRHQRQWVAVPLEDPVAHGDTDIAPSHPSTSTFADLRETLLEDSVPDVEDENTVTGSERYIVQRHAQPTQTVVDLQLLIREDPANNVLPMIELH